VDRVQGAIFVRLDERPEASGRTEMSKKKFAVRIRVGGACPGQQIAPRTGGTVTSNRDEKKLSAIRHLATREAPRDTYVRKGTKDGQPRVTVSKGSYPGK